MQRKDLRQKRTHTILATAVECAMHSYSRVGRTPVMNASENCTNDRKVEHIKRDYDHVFASILKLGDYSNSVRHWNITVIVAYLGVAKACLDKGTAVPILPLLGAIYGFWIMEAFVKAQMYFYREYTLASVDRLFSETDEGRFQQLVEKYDCFLSKDRESPGKNMWCRGGRLHRLFRGLVNCQTLVFYALPLTILIVWCLASSNQFTVKLPLPVILLFPAFLFLLGWTIYWWINHKGGNRGCGQDH
jgi:hypothetical protein